jgi:hypothetical protein
VLVFHYRSGEEIKVGDRVLFHLEPGFIEAIVTGLNGEPDNDWHMTEFGGGIMILEDRLGRTFIHAESVAELEDLEFVGRA